MGLRRFMGCEYPLLSEAPHLHNKWPWFRLNLTKLISLQFGALSNGKTHLTLRNLRRAGTTKRAIPYGYGFNLVSCPNYTFDSISWLAIAIITNSWNGEKQTVVDFTS